MRSARLATARRSTTQSRACNGEHHCLMQMARRSEVGTAHHTAAEPMASRQQLHITSLFRTLQVLL